MKINFEKFKKLSSTGLVLVILSSPITASSDKMYVVKKGDTLSEISYSTYGTIKFSHELAIYNGKKNDDLIIAGETIYIPTKQDLLNASNYTYGYYRIKKGDSIYKKCVEYYNDGSLFKYVGEYNGITDYNNIQIGTVIYFPSLNEIENYKCVCDPSYEYTHIVRKGETLSSISYKYYGDTTHYKEIGDYNGITNYNNIIIGTSLYIPNFSKVKTLK